MVRRLLLIILLICNFICYGQVTIFSENFGSVAGNTQNTSVGTYTGYQNYGLYTYTGNTSIKNSPTVSTGYAGASGGSYVSIPNSIGSYIQISGIDTKCYLSVWLSLGIWKSNTTSNGSDLIIEVSSDNINWTPLSYTLPTGSGTSVWRNITLIGDIPIENNISIRIRQTGTSTSFRIDDINLAGIQNITDSTISNCYGFMYNGVIYTADSVYSFVESGWNGCDSIVRIDYTYDPTDPSCILSIDVYEQLCYINNNSIIVEWHSFNSDYWVIQKLIDNSWVDIGSINCKDCLIMDSSPYYGYNYYRISQGREHGDILSCKYMIQENNEGQIYDILGNKVDVIFPYTLYISVRDNKSHKFIILK